MSEDKELSPEEVKAHEIINKAKEDISKIEELIKNQKPAKGPQLALRPPGVSQFEDMNKTIYDNSHYNKAIEGIKEVSGKEIDHILESCTDDKTKVKVIDIRYSLIPPEEERDSITPLQQKILKDKFQKEAEKQNTDKDSSNKDTPEPKPSISQKFAKSLGYTQLFDNPKNDKEDKVRAFAKNRDDITKE